MALAYICTLKQNYGVSSIHNKPRGIPIPVAASATWSYYALPTSWHARACAPNSRGIPLRSGNLVPFPDPFWWGIPPWFPTFPGNSPGEFPITFLPRAFLGNPQTGNSRLSVGLIFCEFVTQFLSRDSLRIANTRTSPRWNWRCLLYNNNAGKRFQSFNVYTIRLKTSQ